MRQSMIQEDLEPRMKFTTERREFLMRAGAGMLVAANGAFASQPQQQTHRSAQGAISGDFDVRAYGATGDGKTIDTLAINRAIAAAAAAGGGRVIFPAGVYASFSIHLMSKVELHLGPGATILAADPPQAGGSGATMPLSQIPRARITRILGTATGRIA